MHQPIRSPSNSIRVKQQFSARELAPKTGGGEFWHCLCNAGLCQTRPSRIPVILNSEGCYLALYEFCTGSLCNHMKACSLPGEGSHLPCLFFPTRNIICGDVYLDEVEVGAKVRCWVLYPTLVSNHWVMACGHTLQSSVSHGSFPGLMYMRDGMIFLSRLEIGIICRLSKSGNSES
ncbi:hypothetical protein LZ31DRAFT_560168 [Colletotrichum somersetense]|nr:hypothetical protein LZ31DRAFT_560168 [Colletotrichum somersetense]